MKRHPRLRGLSDDHHTALVIATRCKRVPARALADLWEAVQGAMGSHFEPHFAIEEEHLLPALEAIGEGAMAQRIRAEHTSLRDLVADPEPRPETVRAFGDLLERHVRFEEREVFELTQDRLAEAALVDLESACTSHPRSCSLESFGPPLG